MAEPAGVPHDEHLDGRARADRVEQPLTVVEFPDLRTGDCVVGVDMVGHDPALGRDVSEVKSTA